MVMTWLEPAILHLASCFAPTLVDRETRYCSDTVSGHPEGVERLGQTGAKGADYPCRNKRDPGCVPFPVWCGRCPHRLSRPARDSCCFIRPSTLELSSRENSSSERGGLSVELISGDLKSGK